MSRAIYEQALRPPLSTPILIIINDRRRFPTVTRGYFEATRRDATRCAARGVPHDVHRYTTTDRQERERMGRLCASRNISPALADYRDTKSLRIGVHTLKAHVVVAEAARIFIIVGRPLSIYTLPVIIAPDFVTSTTCVDRWNSTLSDPLEFSSFFFPLYSFFLFFVAWKE